MGRPLDSEAPGDIEEAAVAADRAALSIRQAEVSRVQADLDKAIAEEKRSELLLAQGNGFISQREIDEARFGRLAQESQLKLAQASVLQAEANLANSEANLQYTKILSPVDGIVIDRKIDPGQTLAAQFQTPELFVIAPDMQREMHVFASVDEADIGLIRQAHAEQQPVEFTVDAYPEDLFEGTISQIRLSPNAEQNVTTYPVVVSCENPDLKLMPGMTADLSFEIQQVRGAIRIPNAALRYFPETHHVREADRALLDGSQFTDEYENADQLSAKQKTEANRDGKTRHVWVQDGELLRAVKVVVGISDSRYTQLVSEGVSPFEKLVIGVKPKTPK